MFDALDVPTACAAYAAGCTGAGRSSSHWQPTLKAATAKHTTILPNRIPISGTELVKRLALGADAAQVVDDVPHVGVRHAALVTLHLEVGAGAVAEHDEDFPVGIA